MTERFYSPVIKYTTSNLTTLPGALLYFYETGTSTPKTTWTDPERATASAHPVPALADGTFPPIFINGVYRVELKNAAGVTQPGWPVDDVGSPATGFPFQSWSSTYSYSEDDLVTYNGQFYQSLADSNVGNTPSTATAFWQKKLFLDAPTAESYLNGNADGTYTWHTIAQTKTDLSLPTDTVAELALKAPIASPTFTGNPTAPTPSANDNDTSIATTAFVQTELLDRAQTVASIAALTALTGMADGQHFNVSSYNTGWAATVKGPVGGGEFAWDATSVVAENLVTVFERDAGGTGRFLRINFNAIKLSMGGLVGDGTTYEKSKFVACVEAAIEHGVPLHGDGEDYEYLLWNSSDSTDPETEICTLTGVNGFEFDLRGSTLKFNNTFSQAFFILFAVRNSYNIRVHNGVINCTAGTKFNTAGGEEIGVEIVTLIDGDTSNINVHDITGTGWARLVNGRREDTGDPYIAIEDQAKNINVYNIDADDITYCINTQFNGSHIKAWNINLSRVHRAYFPYGVAHHDIEMTINGYDAACARLWGVEGQTLDDVKFKANITQIAGAPAAVEAIQLVFNGTTAAKLSNINVNAAINNASVSNYGVAVIAEGNASSGNHTLENVNIGGSIKNCVSRAVSPIDRGGNTANIKTDNVYWRDLEFNVQGSNSVFQFANSSKKSGLYNVRSVPGSTNPALNIFSDVANFTGLIEVDGCYSDTQIGNTTANLSARVHYRNCQTPLSSSTNMKLLNSTYENCLFAFLSSTLRATKTDTRYFDLSPDLSARPSYGTNAVDSPSAAASVSVTLTAATHFFPANLPSVTQYPRAYTLVVSCQQSTSNVGIVVADLNMVISGGALSAVYIANARAMVEAGSVSASHLSVSVSSGNLVVTMNSGAGSIYDIVRATIFD